MRSYSRISSGFSGANAGTNDATDGALAGSGSSMVRGSRAGDPRGRVVQHPGLLECLRRVPPAHQRVGPVDERLAVVQDHGAIAGGFLGDLRAVAARAGPVVRSWPFPLSVSVLPEQCTQAQSCRTGSKARRYHRSASS